MSCSDTTWCTLQDIHQVQQAQTFLQFIEDPERSAAQLFADTQQTCLQLQRVLPANLVLGYVPLTILEMDTRQIVLLLQASSAEPGTAGMHWAKIIRTDVAVAEDVLTAVQEANFMSQLSQNLLAPGILYFQYYRKLETKFASMRSESFSTTLLRHLQCSPTLEVEYLRSLARAVGQLLSNLQSFGITIGRLEASKIGLVLKPKLRAICLTFEQAGCSTAETSIVGLDIYTLLTSLSKFPLARQTFSTVLSENFTFDSNVSAGDAKRLQDQFESLPGCVKSNEQAVAVEKPAQQHEQAKEEEEEEEAKQAKGEEEEEEEGEEGEEEREGEEEVEQAEREEEEGEEDTEEEEQEDGRDEDIEEDNEKEWDEDDEEWDEDDDDAGGRQHRSLSSRHSSVSSTSRSRSIGPRRY